MKDILLTLWAMLALSVAASADITNNQTRHKSTFEAKTETRRMELNVTEAHRRVRLDVKYRLTAGELHLKLRDPRGRVRQDTGFSPDGKYKVDTGDLEAEMEAVPGVWTLEVGLRDATGNYEMTLTASRP